MSKSTSNVGKRTLRICKNGHKYYKSSDCPVCPICEKQKTSPTGFMSMLAAPARRALENADIKTLKDLSKRSEKELLKLHGFGKASLPQLKSALEANGLTFREND